MSTDIIEKYVAWRNDDFSLDSLHLGYLRMLVSKKYADKDPDMRKFVIFMNNIEGSSHPIRQKLREAAVDANNFTYNNAMKQAAINWEEAFIKRILKIWQNEENRGNVDHPNIEKEIYKCDLHIDWRCPKCGILWFTSTNLPSNKDLTFMPQHDECNVQRRPVPHCHKCGKQVEDEYCEHVKKQQKECSNVIRER